MTRLAVSFVAIAAATTLPTQPTAAQWNYDPSMSAATAYCAARDSGKTSKQADRALTDAIALAAGGGFSSSIATVLTGGRAAIERARYMARQMCPQWFEPAMPTYPLPDPTTKPWPYNDL
jgi:hypothetical protein